MSASKFRPASKRNPCPVCGDSSGKCRDNGDVTLCMPLGDTRVGEVVGQYKCIANKNSGWATFKIDNSAEWNEERRREWEDQKRHREQEKAREDEERRRRSLSPEERDKGYRLLLGQMELHSRDRADLLKRGFTEQEIEAHGFKSVVANQKLSSPLLPALPGVKPDGWSLAVGGDGYLCPVLDDGNLIIGLQIRLREPSDDNRYRWLSSHNAVLSLPNGENPIGMYLPPNGKPEGIALVEGVGAKPRLAAKLLNHVVIGAAGGQFRQSPAQLKSYLSLFDFDTLVIPFDAGEITNKQRLNSVWRPLKKLLSAWGYQVKVAWWKQFTKEDRDIDEGVELNEIEYLSWSEFESLINSSERKDSNKPQPRIANANKPKADGLCVDHLDKARQRWRNSRKFTADININSPTIYGNIPQSESGTVLLINSGLGTGKTYYSYKEIERNDDYGWLNPGHRNFLLKQFCGESGFYHLQSELKGVEYMESMPRDPYSKISFSIESIIHFKPEDFDGRIVLIDEVESVVEQLLIGNTSIKKWRKRAKYLFEECLKRADRIIAMDGHLSDFTANYIAALAGGKRVIKVKNHYKGKCSNKVFLHTSTASLEKHLKKKGIKQPFVIASDSQIFLEAMESVLREAGLPGAGIRLDSSTKNQEWAQEFLRDANAPAEFILKHKIYTLSYSPSAESGLNVDLPGYFKTMYVNLVGVLSTNQQCQIIKRLRDTEIPIHLYCSPKGFNNESRGESTPDEIDEALKQYKADCAAASFEGIDMAETLNKYVAKLIEETNSPHYKRECEIKAFRGYERANLKACLKEALQESGYTLEEYEDDDDARISWQLKKSKEAVKDSVCAIKANAPLISREDADTLQHEQSMKLDREQSAKIWKRNLVDRLPGIETAVLPVGFNNKPQFTDTPVDPPTEETKTQVTNKEPVPIGEPVPLLNKDFIKRITFTDKTLIRRIEDFYFLQNPEITKRFQQENWAKEIDKSFDSEDTELQIVGYRSRWLKVKTLLDLGITKFLQPGVEWTNDSPEVVAFWEASKNKRVSSRSGYSPGKAKPAQFINAVLSSLGFVTQGRRPSQGDRQRVYTIKARPLDDPIQAAIYESVERRERARFDQLERIDWDSLAGKAKNELEGWTAQNPDTARAEACPTPANFSYIYKGEVGQKESQGVSVSAPPPINSLGALTVGDVCVSKTTGDAVKVVGFTDKGRVKVRYLQPMGNLSDEAEVRIDWLKPVA